MTPWLIFSAFMAAAAICAGAAAIYLHVKRMRRWLWRIRAEAQRVQDYYEAMRRVTRRTQSI